jgi:uncharacterized protein (DUF2147 family)
MLRFSSFSLALWLAATAIGLAATPAGAQSTTPVGVWLHDNKRIEIEITPCGETLCGKLVWFKRPNDAQGLPLVDLNNPDSALRARPLIGLVVLNGLRRTGENTWENGSIYDPDDGATYNASMSMQDDGALQVRAYVLMPMLGKTFVWTRMRAIEDAPKQGS